MVRNGVEYVLGDPDSPELILTPEQEQALRNYEAKQARAKKGKKNKRKQAKKSRRKNRR
jgi:prophage tail gpP-like protein